MDPSVTVMTANGEGLKMSWKNSILISLFQALEERDVGCKVMNRPAR